MDQQSVSRISHEVAKKAAREILSPFGLDTPLAVALAASLIIGAVEAEEPERAEQVAA